MSGGKYYQYVIGALRMLGKRTTINNKLNSVFAHSTDDVLGGMVGDVIAKLPYKGINHAVITLTTVPLTFTTKPSD